MVQMTLARVVGEARKAGFDNISIDLDLRVAGANNRAMARYA